MGCRIARAGSKGIPEYVITLSDNRQDFGRQANVFCPRLSTILCAREHVWSTARLLYPADSATRKRCGNRIQKMLDKGKVESLVLQIRTCVMLNKEATGDIEKEAEYFERNKARMRYSEFRRQGLFVGSGVIEAGCKNVIGRRLKQSGMFWTVRGANSIIALRCCRSSGRFEDHWASSSAVAAEAPYLCRAPPLILP